MTRSTANRRLVRSSLAALVIACGLPSSAAPPLGMEPRPDADASAPAGRLIIDHAVVPAGGGRCPHCPGGRCRHADGMHRSRGHHRHCRPGMCVPHCPVRPAEFGFYGTQWRRWPGQQVVPVSADAATPAMPPKSEVPAADEESPRRPDEEGSEGTAAGAATPAAVPSASESPDDLPPQPPLPPEPPEGSAPGEP